MSKHAAREYRSIAGRNGAVSRLGLLAAASAVCVMASAVSAQHIDIELTIDESGTIRTGLFDLDNEETVIVDERVFEVVMPGTNFTNNPGFNSATGVFAPFTSVGFRLGGPLLEWDGGGFLMIAPERVEVTFSTFPPLGPIATPDEPETVVEGFTITVGSNGRWHRHLEYRLVGEGGSAPRAGLYAMPMLIFSTDPAVNDSDWFWLVFNKDVPALEAAAAMEWARDNLLDGVPPVPCPADIDGDGTVSIADYFAFLTLFFDQLGGQPVPGDPSADIDGDGVVSVADYFEFLGLFFESLGTDCE